MTETTTNWIVDEVTNSAGDRHEVTRIYKIGTDTVRIRMRRDLYPDHSFAVVEVLTTDRKWTQLINEPVWNWYFEVNCPDYALDIDTGLHVVADRLYERAAAILT